MFDKRQYNKASFKAIIYENLIPLSAQYCRGMSGTKELNTLGDKMKSLELFGELNLQIIF